MEKSKFLQPIKNLWQPKKLEEPRMNLDIQPTNRWQRSLESVRYSMLRLEYWASPNGQIREWMRLNARLAAAVGIPLILIVPLVTFLLGQLQAWLVYLTAICGKVIVFPATLLLAYVMILLIIHIIKSLLSVK